MVIVIAGISIMIGSTKIDIFEIMSNTSNLGTELEFPHFKFPGNMQGWKYLCLVVINNTELHEQIWLNKYRIFLWETLQYLQGLKIINQTEKIVQNLCYHANIHGVKYVN